MATPKFQPHGFIDTPQLEVQYRTAHFSNYFEDVFINSQQPPEINSRKACDIVIEYTESGTFHTRVLCFIECKRTKKTTGYDLEQVEKQALEYCMAYLGSDDNLSVVYACTAIGAHIRCWRLFKGEEAFLGFWGGTSPAARDQYKDVGVDADAALIRWAIDYMIALPPTGREGQTIDDYGSIYAGQGK
ncbi:MAG: hypothetical protein M1835_001659 [Candelina submexicana]|nr:MAG: hypothetical protein M1835_001659 [Candelina submexicana]